VVRTGGIAAVGGTTGIILPLAEVPRLFRRVKSIDSLEIGLAEGASGDGVKLALEQMLRAQYPDLDGRLPESEELLALETLRSIETGLRMASSLAFVVAVFMVLNAFFISLGERRRQLALLRTVGASRSQVLAMVLSEAVLFGIVATLIGIPLGA